MSTQEQVEAIESEIITMLDLLQQIHDEASAAMYCHPAGVTTSNYRVKRHEQLSDAVQAIRDLARTDWSYTP